MTVPQTLATCSGGAVTSSKMTTSCLQITDTLLLKAITAALSRYAGETDPYVFFNGLLEALLELTVSEYGFIGEVFHTDRGEPYIKSYATTNIAWNDETQRLYERTRKKGMVFSRLDCLYGAVLTTGNLIISNNPSTDTRSCGLPPGHPPLNSFMGVPLYGRGALLGMVGLANRVGGYQRSLAKVLEPFFVTCGNLIQAYRDNLQKETLEREIQRYEQQLERPNNAISLGFGYTFAQSPSVLMKDDCSVLLTRKELDLLELLAKNSNQVVHYSTLEAHVWKDVVVGKSSLRSLVRRIRKKVPEINITTVRGVGLMLTTHISDLLSEVK